MTGQALTGRTLASDRTAALPPLDLSKVIAATGETGVDSISQLALSAARARTASTGDGSGHNFAALDYAKQNDGRHNSARTDTFNTPGKLEKKYNTPGALDKRYGLSDSYTMIEICEKAFNKSSDKLCKDLIQNVREEASQLNEQLRQDMAANVRTLIEAHEATVSATLTEVMECVRQRQASADFVKVDLVPLREMLQQETGTQLKSLDGQITRRVSDIQDELRVVRLSQEETLAGHHAKAAAGLDETVEASRRAAESLSLLVDGYHRVEASSEQCSKDVVELMEAQRSLSRHVLQVDFAVIQTEIHSGQRELRVSFLEILSELAQLQQHMNCDFANVSYVHALLGELWQGPSGLVRQGSGDKSTNGRLGSIQQGSLPGLQAGKSKTSKSMMSTSTSSLVAAETVGPSSKVCEPVGSTNGGVQMSVVAQADSNMMDGLRDRKRMREYMTQTDGGNVTTVEVQTLPMCDKKKTKGKSNDAPPPPPVTTLAKPKRTQVFADAEAMKKKARSALVKPQYNVFNYYWTTGICQRVAKSPLFENITFTVIALNAVWISVDMDNNDADLLVDANPVFIIADNFFCLYFTAELSFRFGSYQLKRHCLKDFWFMFDALMVSMMILETWVLSAIYIFAAPDGGSGGMANLSILRIARLAKLVRVSRMVRLLRSIPELVILLKGIGASLRTVFVFCVLWLVIIYVFAIFFVGVTEGENVGEQKFGNVPVAMNTLLLKGILPTHASLVTDVVEFSPWLWPIIVFFIILASMTLLNMLVGVMVSLISAIAITQTEAMSVVFVAGELREAMTQSGRDMTINFKKAEFQEILCDSTVAKIISEAGVDVVALLDTTDVIFQDLESKGSELSFEGFLDIILNMRGSNPVTVKDVKEQLRTIKNLVRDAGEYQIQLISDEFGQLRSEIYARDVSRDAREAQRKAEEEDMDEEEDDEDSAVSDE